VTTYHGIELSAARPRQPQQLVPIVDALPAGLRTAVIAIALNSDGSLRVETRNARSKVNVAKAFADSLLVLHGRHPAMSVGRDVHRVNVPATELTGPIRAF
jgi:hypothetical protein